MKTLYITDLDGTLLNKDQKVSPKSIEIINRLIDKGLLFTYATARSIVSASKVTEGLDITIPVVTGNGVSIVHPQSHKLISTLAFTKQEKNQLAESLKKRQIYPLVRAYVDGQDKCIWVKNKENPALCNYLNEPVRKIDPRLYPVSEFDDLWQGEVFYIICMGFEGELDSLYEDIRQQEKYRSLLTQQLYNTDFWLEIMPEQATKSNAILELKKMLNCDRIICFGDGINDITMFQIADECYAVENAVEEVKEIADGIIGSNEEDGVAKWLEKQYNRGLIL